MVERTTRTRVELFLSAKNLADKDLISKSDPYCVTSLQELSSSNFQEISRTEIIKDCLSPTWTKTTVLDYHFEYPQILQFSVYDSDGQTSDFLGSATIPLSQIIKKRIAELPLSERSVLVIRIEEMKPSSEGCEITVRGHKLDKKDFFGKSDPYLIIKKYLGNESWAEVHRTEIIKKTLNPTWKPFVVSSQMLCNEDRLKPIKIECFDWDRMSKDDFIGSAEINYVQLTSEGFQFELWGKKKSKGKNSGFIQIEKVVFGRFPSSLIDYLQSGLEISLSVAIDFSDSSQSNNGVDLHRQSPNQFISALREVGTRLEVFDTDKLIPVYGFAGDIGKGQVNNCFALNFNEKNPYVSGIEGVVDCYQQGVRRVSSSWPLNYHNVIEKVVKECKELGQSSKVYHILLILATGEIDDLDETALSVLNSCKFPVSIIIAGIGSSNFTRIRQFEERILNSLKDIEKGRENLQFVRFNAVRGDCIAVAAEVLKKIPGHIIEYMELVGFRPLIKY